MTLFEGEILPWIFKGGVLFIDADAFLFFSFLLLFWRRKMEFSVDFPRCFINSVATSVFVMGVLFCRYECRQVFEVVVRRRGIASLNMFFLILRCEKFWFY